MTLENEFTKSISSKALKLVPRAKPDFMTVELGKSRAYTLLPNTSYIPHPHTVSFRFREPRSRLSSTEKAKTSAPNPPPPQEKGLFCTRNVSLNHRLTLLSMTNQYMHLKPLYIPSRYKHTIKTAQNSSVARVSSTRGPGGDVEIMMV